MDVKRIDNGTKLMLICDDRSNIEERLETHFPDELFWVSEIVNRAICKQFLVNNGVSEKDVTIQMIRREISEIFDYQIIEGEDICGIS